MYKFVQNSREKRFKTIGEKIVRNFKTKLWWKKIVTWSLATAGGTRTRTCTRTRTAHASGPCSDDLCAVDKSVKRC
jgi:hypothetical protein